MCPVLYKFVELDSYYSYCKQFVMFSFSRSVCLFVSPLSRYRTHPAFTDTRHVCNEVSNYRIYISCVPVQITCCVAYTISSGVLHFGFTRMCEDFRPVAFKKYELPRRYSACGIMFSLLMLGQTFCPDALTFMQLQGSGIRAIYLFVLIIQLHVIT